jgi:hypothetical protein
VSSALSDFLVATALSPFSNADEEAPTDMRVAEGMNEYENAWFVYLLHVIIDVNVV